MGKTPASLVDHLKLVPPVENGDTLEGIGHAAFFLADPDNARNFLVPELRKIANPTTFMLGPYMIILEQVPVDVGDKTIELIIRRVCADASLISATIQYRLAKDGGFNPKALTGHVSGPWSKGPNWTTKLSVWWAEQRAGWAWARASMERAKLGHS